MRRALLFILVFLPMLASAQDAVEIDGIYYNLDSEAKTAEVSRNLYYKGNITIPETVKYDDVVYNVTAIGEETFHGCSGLTSVIIPSSVTSIGNGAFVGCRALTSVTIPDGVTSIGRFAFESCIGLTSVTIPDGVTSIGYGTFMGCRALTSVTIGNSVTSIGNYAFDGCSNLTSITIPNSVTSINDYAFAYCTGLTSVTIPNSVTSIGIGAFMSCSSLTSVIIPSSVTSIGDQAFAYCYVLTSITIPYNVTSIGEYAFEKCSGLTSVTISGSVTSIGIGAFVGCSSLTSVTIPDGVTSIGNSAFAGCGLTSITIPSSVTSIGMNPFGECSGLESIAVENGNPVYDSRESCKAIIKTSDNELISGCMNSTIPNSVTKIGQAAFQACKGLRSVRIPNSVVAVGQNAFYDCSGLTSITIPNNVTSIGEAAFRGCSGLTSITIPNSVTSIGEYVFYECSGLTSVTIPNSVTFIGLYAFSRCSGLTSVTIPNSVTFIANEAFRSCSGLTSITIGSGTITICDQVFACCPELTDVYCYAESVPYTYADSHSNAFKDSSIEYATLHVPVASVSAYQATEPWKNFKEIVALPDQGDETDNADYLPMVKEGKTWHVVGSDGECNMIEYMLMDGEVVKDGKNYFRLYSKTGEVVRDLGLLREEGKKVYYYDSRMQEEFLLFDYSLKPGDTFETYCYDDHTKMTYEVMSVDDRLVGPEIVRYDYDEAADSVIIHRRHLRQWTVRGIYDGVEIEKTWIEGIGSSGGGPLANLYLAHAISTGVFLAYVDDSQGDLYLPFSIKDGLWGLVSGCDLPTSEAESSEYDGHHHLTYELEGDRLHVYGEVFCNCGPNHYAYFMGEPYEDSSVSVHKYSFIIQEVEPLKDCMALHTTDFYVEGFYPEYNYIIVDNLGEEHPVINKTAQIPYHPMIEEGKVWKVGASGSGNPVQLVEYFYFDGDTIINGKTCKQMMCQRYVNADYAESHSITQYPSLSYVGAWYEGNKQVYTYDTTNNQFKLMYDFSVGSNGIRHFNNQLYTVGPRRTGGIKGFKGVYRDAWMYFNSENIVSWLEGVGGIYGPTINVIDGESEDPMWFLMACVVGDEVIYFNDEYEDGATPEGARKRFDFTHTIKIQPKSRMRSGEELPLYGEYNDQQLGINLDPLDDAYQVRITDETGQTVYEKAIDAGNIVGLNIDISAFAKGRYIVTVENDYESFTGEFEAETTGIEEVRSKKEKVKGHIYNLQGQRLSTLRKGLNIVNGQKVYVK